MNTDAGALLTTVIGVLLARLAFEGTFRRYVKPAMGTVAGRRRCPPRSARPRRAVAPPSRRRRSRHQHGGERVAWLLVAPVLAILLIAPPSLGTYALDRAGSAVTVRSGGGTFASLDPATAPHEMTLLEFNQRAFEGDATGASFSGAPVRLIGFVGPTKDDGFLVARFQIACCAADACWAPRPTSWRLGWSGAGVTAGSRSRARSSPATRRTRSCSRCRSRRCRRRMIPTSEAQAMGAR